MTINEAKNLCNNEIADRYHTEAREYLKYLLDRPDTKFETKITKLIWVKAAPTSRSATMR
jgi:hypothetical protein